MDLSTPLTYVKGVGPARAAYLEAKNLHTVEDLLYYAPFRYEDRSNVKLIRQLAPGEMATVIAEVYSSKVAGNRRRNLGMFEATFQDASGSKLKGKWFHGAYLADILTPGKRVSLFAKVEWDSYGGGLSMMHPEFEILSANADEEDDAALHTGRIVPIYEAAGKVHTRLLRTLTHRILENLSGIDDALPEHIRERLKLASRWEAIRALHFPSPDSDLRLLNSFRSPAQFRMVFEEFFWLECGLERKRQKARAEVGIAFELTARCASAFSKCCPSSRPARSVAYWEKSRRKWPNLIRCIV